MLYMINIIELENLELKQKIPKLRYTMFKYCFTLRSNVILNLFVYQIYIFKNF